MSTGAGSAVQKRPHRKSRNGCLQCKREKIKCDERKPCCGHCLRFQASCSFSPTATTAVSAPDSGVSASPEPQKSTPSGLISPQRENSNVPQSIDLEVDNLELLHFYTTNTCFTLSSRPDFHPIWQEVVPRLAFRNHFLLNAVLAFSALHLAQVKPERRSMLYATASLHYDKGLEAFRRAISNITPDNCDACFAFSSIITAYTWTSSDQTSPLFFADTVGIGTLSVDWVTLLRGVQILLETAGPWMATGPMAAVLQPRHMDPKEVNDLDPEASNKLLALRQIWVPSASLDVNQLNTLNLTLALLHEAYGLVVSASHGSDVDPILVVYSWPIQVPEAFLVMVREEKPEALIVLAYYSLLLNKVDDLWYMRGMSRRLLESIYGKLGKEWESWIAWPLQHLVITDFKNKAKSTTTDSI